DLINERPIAERRSEQCHVVQSSLRRQFSLVLFLLTAVKHKDLGPTKDKISWGTSKQIFESALRTTGTPNLLRIRISEFQRRVRLTRKFETSQWRAGIDILGERKHLKGVAE